MIPPQQTIHHHDNSTYHYWPGCLVAVSAPWSSQQSHGWTAENPGPASWTPLECTHTQAQNISTFVNRLFLQAASYQRICQVVQGDNNCQYHAVIASYTLHQSWYFHRTSKLNTDLIDSSERFDTAWKKNPSQYHKIIEVLMWVHACRELQLLRKFWGPPTHTHSHAVTQHNRRANY